MTGAMATIFAAAFSANAQTTLEQQKALTPDVVLKDLMDGNARYVAGKVTQYDVDESRKAVVKGQHPKAVILSCIDSRVPVELVFDQKIGDVFVGRVAGNVENEDQLGSMEYATKFAGSKLVVVLGHESCGAVKGACDGLESGNITVLLDKIEPAVKAVPGYTAETRNSKNEDFVKDVVHQNVRNTVADIRKRSKDLRELEEAGKIKIVGAYYNLHTGEVTLVK